MTIDLRSDTVTKPTNGMLDAMLSAEVGDDVFSEDPTVNALQNRVAAMFNKSAALFFPSGSMANQVALKLHTKPSEQVICHKYAHIFNYEAGGASFHSGISCNLLQGEGGMFKANQVQEAINPEAYYYSKTSLVAIENTTNKGGGACWDINELQEIRKVCDTNNLGYHLDGARLWNALAAKNEQPAQYGALFDTISVCFSKGLGCPIGSMLIGDEGIMSEAIRLRKLFGGNMRQVGYLAAAADYALSNHLNRFEQDHQKAQEIGKVLSELNDVKMVAPIETNIIIFELHTSVNEQHFIQRLKDEQILIIGMGGGKLRMVTHLDYTDKMHEKVMSVLRNYS